MYYGNVARIVDTGFFTLHSQVMFISSLFFFIAVSIVLAYLLENLTLVSYLGVIQGAHKRWHGTNKNNLILRNWTKG